MNVDNPANLPPATFELNPKGRLFLVGFMGAGKSTVGPILGTALRWDFVDLDVEIERTYDRPIREIFRTEGEQRFREMETEALKRLAERCSVVTALGGGTFVDEKNREIIKQLGISIYLECTFETILARCPSDGTRPLLQSVDQARTMFVSRQPLYRRSDICIDTSQLSPNEIVSAILLRLNIAPEGTAS